MKKLLFIALLFALPAFGQVSHVAANCTNKGTGTSASGSFTFSCTPNATNNAIVFTVSCAGTGTATNITLAATGWSFTNISAVLSDGFGFSRTIAAIAPNASATTFTATFTGMSACGSFTLHLHDEFTGNDSTGGATTFYATNSNSASSGGAGCTGAAVTSTSANDAVVATCVDNLATTNWQGSGWSQGVNDSNGDGTEYKIATGSQTPAWASTTGNFIATTTTIKAAGGAAPVIMPPRVM